MPRMSTLSAMSALAVGAMMLMAAADPSPFGQTQPGLWEISGAPGNGPPVRECVADVAALARFEHRASSCSAKVLRQGGTSASIEYSCGAAGFGHSQIDVITPRSLRISTQGISGGFPFNYVLQARRVDDCVKTTASTRH
jgi:hypothetical protein